MQDYPIDEWSMFGKLSDSFFIALLIDILSLTAIVWLIYFRKYRKKEFLFAFYLFNIIIYTMTYLLNEVEMSIGAALGLFAVFSMLRYRTESISTKDMVYLFVAISVGLLSATERNFAECILMNCLVILGVIIIEKTWLLRSEQVYEILYENLDLIASDKNNELIEDLRRRTGLMVHRVTVEEILYDRSVAKLNVYYYDKKTQKK